jgi:tRNA (adenine37-N6)-methyltransferase
MAAARGRDLRRHVTMGVMSRWGVMDLEPIGWVQSTQRVPGGRGHGWDKEIAAIKLDSARFEAAALMGLASFSHIEVVFIFDQLDPSLVENGARRPAGRADWPEVGIFAQRYSHRPNRIGVSRCRLLAVEGVTVHVGGLDAIDGTPVLDIKPWMAEYGPRGDVSQPAWSHELMADYWTGPSR